MIVQEQQQEQTQVMEVAQTPPPSADIKEQIAFAERCFINGQDLNRLLDFKASFLLSAVALLTAALGVVATRALDVTAVSSWLVALKDVAVAAFLVYLVVAFVVVNSATSVFKALPNLVQQRPPAPGLIFPLILLSRFRSGGQIDMNAYYNRLCCMSPAEILKDYANQVMEISAIYARKQRHINFAANLFHGLTACWILTMMLLLATIILR